MIVRKNWERYRSDWFGPRQVSWNCGTLKRTPQYLDVYDGWFLFGFIPLYIQRDRQPLVDFARR